jgi:hypothetical protein
MIAPGMPQVRRNSAHYARIAVSGNPCKPPNLDQPVSLMALHDGPLTRR